MLPCVHKQIKFRRPNATELDSANMGGFYESTGMTVWMRSNFRTAGSINNNCLCVVQPSSSDANLIFAAVFIIYAHIVLKVVGNGSILTETLRGWFVKK